MQNNNELYCDYYSRNENKTRKAEKKISNNRNTDTQTHIRLNVCIQQSV